MTTNDLLVADYICSLWPHFLRSISHETSILRNKHRISVFRYNKYVPPRPILLPRRQIDGHRNLLILPKSSVAGQNQSGIKLLNLPPNAKAIVIPKNAKVVRTGEGGQMKLLVPTTTSPQKQTSYMSRCHLCQFKTTNWKCLGDHLRTVHKEVLTPPKVASRVVNNHDRDQIDGRRTNNRLIYYIACEEWGRFRCKLCNFVGPSMPGLKSHLGMVHRKKICRFCDFVGSDGVILREHEKCMHGDHFSKDYGYRKGSYYCKHRTCADGLYDREDAMIAHVRRAHGVQGGNSTA